MSKINEVAELVEKCRNRGKSIDFVLEEFKG